jgi:hypothetical protein
LAHADELTYKSTEVMLDLHQEVRCLFERDIEFFPFEILRPPDDDEQFVRDYMVSLKFK